MTKSIKAIQAAAAKRMAKPYTGTQPDVRNTAAGNSAAITSARERQDKTAVDYALGLGAYDRIKGS